MNEFSCSEHSVRIRRSKKRSTGNQALVRPTLVYRIEYLEASKSSKKAMYTVHSNAIYSWFLSKTKPKLVILNRRRSQGSFFFCSRDPLWFWCFFTLSNCLFLFHSDEGPTLETLGFTIRIGSTPTFSYFDLYLYSTYAAHYVYFNNKMSSSGFYL